MMLRFPYCKLTAYPCAETFPNFSEILTIRIVICPPMLGSGLRLVLTATTCSIRPKRFDDLFTGHESGAVRLFASVQGQLKLHAGGVCSPKDSFFTVDFSTT